MKINEFVKKVRKKLGLTQTEFGQLVGKNRSTIAKYELGLAIPPGDVLLNIQGLDADPR